MLPAVFALITGDSDASALIGTRVYRHGDAPQGVSRPYVTWFVAGGGPENTFELPSIDQYSVQVDCWSDSDAEVESVAESVRSAIESSYHVTSVIANSRDPETMRYRIGMVFTFWADRP